MAVGVRQRNAPAPHSADAPSLDAMAMRLARTMSAEFHCCRPTLIASTEWSWKSFSKIVVVGKDSLLHHANDVVLGMRHGESACISLVGA